MIYISTIVSFPFLVCHMQNIWKVGISPLVPILNIDHIPVDSVVVQELRTLSLAIGEHTKLCTFIYNIGKINTYLWTTWLRDRLKGK